MCRILAAPPNFSKAAAIGIVREFYGNNSDGVGTVYAKNGKLIVNKTPLPLPAAIMRRVPLFDHMPYNGWTLVHLRAASHGHVAMENTHPFIANDRAYIHNGVWSEYEIAQSLLAAEVKFEGDTDSEVAAHYLARIGRNHFLDTIDRAGVWMSLGIDGDLEVIKTSGDLCVSQLGDKQYVIASTLSDERYPTQNETETGWITFGPDGKYLKHRVANPSSFGSAVGTTASKPVAKGVSDFCFHASPILLRRYAEIQQGHRGYGW